MRTREVRSALSGKYINIRSNYSLPTTHCQIRPIANELSHHGDEATEDVASATVCSDDEAGSSPKSGQQQYCNTAKSHI